MLSKWIVFLVLAARASGSLAKSFGPLLQQRPTMGASKIVFSSGGEIAASYSEKLFRGIQRIRKAMNIIGAAIGGMP